MRIFDVSLMVCIMFMGVYGNLRGNEEDKQYVGAAWQSAHIDTCKPGCSLQQGACVCNIFETNNSPPPSPYTDTRNQFSQCAGKTPWGTASLTCTPGQCCHIKESGPSCEPC